MQSEKPIVISTGNNLELLWLRNAVLQSAGFHVITTENEDEALFRIERGNCGVLLLCYSLSGEGRKRLVDSFRKHCPNGRIVAIADERVDNPEFADMTVYGIEGPEALIDAIRKPEYSQPEAGDSPEPVT